MKQFSPIRKYRKARRQTGMGLIELMISMFILAVGLIGILGIILAAMTSNNRNKSDSGATFISQMIIEDIAAAGAATSLTLTDGCGTTQTLTLTTSSSGAGATLYTTSTAPTASLANTIDWTQDASSVTSGYQMYWCTKDANNINQTFDVRWNMKDLSSTLSAQTKMIVVGARPKAARTTEIRRFAMPATLKMIATN